MRGAAVDRQAGLTARAARKNRKAPIFLQALEQTVPGHPFFAQNERLAPAVSVLSQEKALKIGNHFFIRRGEAKLVDHGCRQRPVIVEAAPILKLLDKIAPYAAATDMLDRADNRFMIRIADIHQNSVQIKNQQPAHPRTSRKTCRKRRS